MPMYDPIIQACEGHILLFMCVPSHAHSCGHLGLTVIPYTVGLPLSR